MTHGWQRMISAVQDLQYDVGRAAVAASCGCRVLDPPLTRTHRAPLPRLLYYPLPRRCPRVVLLYTDPVWVFATPPGFAWSTVVVGQSPHAPTMTHYLFKNSPVLYNTLSSFRLRKRAFAGDGVWNIQRACRASARVGAYGR